MKLSELKKVLGEVDEVRFILPDGSNVPEHFHVTEVGKIDKHFIDCGGTVRKESVGTLILEQNRYPEAVPVAIDHLGTISRCFED